VRCEQVKRGTILYMLNILETPFIFMFEGHVFHRCKDNRWILMTDMMRCRKCDYPVKKAYIDSMKKEAFQLLVDKYDDVRANERQLRRHLWTRKVQDSLLIPSNIWEEISEDGSSLV